MQHFFFLFIYLAIYFMTKDAELKQRSDSNRRVLPGLHVLCFVMTRWRHPCALMRDVLLELHQWLQVLLLVLLLLFVAGQDEEQTQDALQIPITHLWRSNTPDLESTTGLHYIALHYNALHWRAHHILSIGSSR